MRTAEMNIRHLYVHIPFCRSRCAYCDFFSEPVGPHARAGRLDRYMAAVRSEIAAATAGNSPAAALETVYVGGGTPTALPGETLPAFLRHLTALLRNPPVAARDADPPTAARTAEPREARGRKGPAGPELTVEANPGSVDAAQLERLARAGVTRLSLGVQSFEPRLRGALGRKVRQEKIAASLSAIAMTGWRDWNLDLVFGIPGQSWADAAEDLDRAISAGPTHISLYDLTYPPAYRARVEAVLGRPALVAAVAFAERCYAKAVAHLEAGGYRRYEVSNFALPGYECLHNQAYWRGEDYLGVGAGAVSTVGGERRTNVASVVDYLAGRRPRVEVLSPATRLWEGAMLGLRTSEGIEEATFLSVLDGEARERLVAQGCLERRCGKLRLNTGFMNVSNAVISTLLVPPEG